MKRIQLFSPTDFLRQSESTFTYLMDIKQYRTEVTVLAFNISEDLEEIQVSLRAKVGPF